MFASAQKTPTRVGNSISFQGSDKFINPTHSHFQVTKISIGCSCECVNVIAAMEQ